MKKYRFIYLLSLLLSALFINVQAAETGIKVHGHWKFDIYHADGSIDRTVEFENSLVSNGAEALVTLLAKNYAVNLWQIHMFSSAGFEGPCKDNTNQPHICIIHETGEPVTFPYEFSNMTVTNNTNKLTLQGSMITASGLANPAIGNVTTYLQLCDVSSGTCVPTNFSLFTSKSISNVPLQAGQVVQVTVEISFS